MKKAFIIFLLSMILLPSIADAQRWKRFRRQIVVGGGVTNFLGELGGGNSTGREGLADLDFAATRPSLLFGYRYQVNNFFFLRSNIQWGILRGDDQYTEEKYRNGRNLSFRTGFFELNAMAEFYLIQNAQGNLYRLRGVRGRRGLQMDLYLFAGVGFMYFNPKAEYEGEWVALQPLGTEGQGLPGQKEKYNRTSFTIPYGIGVGKSLDRYWAINLEFTMRMVFTDYIDDVSGDYYGRKELIAAKGGSSNPEAVKAGALSDRNIYHETIGDISSYTPTTQVEPGGQRGNPDDNDSFMTGMLTISRKIVKRRRSRPKF